MLLFTGLCIDLKGKLEVDVAVTSPVAILNFDVLAAFFVDGWQLPRFQSRLRLRCISGGNKFGCGGTPVLLKDRFGKCWGMLGEEVLECSPDLG